MHATRVQLYALIDSFETDIRKLLDQYVVPHMDERQLLGAEYEEAFRRRSEDGAAENVPLAYFLDLRPAYDRLNAHRRLLPEEVAREVRELTPQLDIIVAVRKRVMHPRPFQHDDRERVMSAFRMFGRHWWPTLHSTLDRVSADPNWSPIGYQPSTEGERVLHNLPLPDYDDTGLRGRDKEVASLISALRRGRDNVLTLVGEGGIGKTAIALDAAYRLLDDDVPPFEVILWVSLKTERLTGTGVRAINKAVTSVLGVAEVLGRGLDHSFEGGLRELANTLDGVSTLICLDNLETVNGDEFVALYETLPDSIRYLVTSREGIGQLERRVTVAPLQEHDALILLNRLITDRAVPALTGISASTRTEIVNRLRRSPLGIRWFILAVEAGRSPRELILDQSELLDFCVRSVYENVSPSGRRALIAMHTLRRTVTVDDLVVLTSLPSSQVASAMQELSRGSLVGSTLSADAAMVVHFELSETARAFMDRHADDDDPVRLQIAEAEAQFRRDEERRQIESGTRSLAPIVVRTRYPTDGPTAQLLRRALLKSQARNYTAAFDLVAEAKRLNPELWEVYRVEAFLHATGGSRPLATPLYLEAYRLADTEEHQAIVAHFFAGHLSRNEHNLDEAIRYAEEAHNVLRTPESGLALANLHVWQNMFEDGTQLLGQFVSETSGRTRLIALTSEIEAYRRWSEYILAEERHVVEAFARARMACGKATAAFQAGIADTKVLETGCESFAQALKCIVAGMDAGIVFEPPQDFVDSLSNALPRLRRSKRFWDLELCAEDITRRDHGVASAYLALAEIVLATPQDVTYHVESAPQRPPKLPNGPKPATSTEITTPLSHGVIASLVPDRGFGFIGVDGAESNVFFHRSAVDPAGAFESLVVGVPVWFHRVKDAQGRDRASVVVDSDPVEHIPHGRVGAGTGKAFMPAVGESHEGVSGVIARVYPQKHFGFASASMYELDVFFHESVCSDGADISSLQEGQPVLMTVSRNEKGLVALKLERSN